MLIPGPSIPGIHAPGVPIPVQQAPASQGPSPVELIDGMLKLATVYRSVEAHAGDRLKMEKVTTLLQQILADQDSAAAAPAFGSGFGRR